MSRSCRVVPGAWTPAPSRMFGFAGWTRHNMPRTDARLDPGPSGRLKKGRGNYPQSEMCTYFLEEAYAGNLSSTEGDQQVLPLHEILRTHNFTFVPSQFYTRPLPLPPHRAIKKTPATHFLSLPGKVCWPSYSSNYR